MGYRCPNCHKDFGVDKEKLEEHFLNNPECGAEASVIKHILPISLGIEKPKKRYGSRRFEYEEPKEKRHIDHISENHVWVKDNAVTNDDGSDTMVCKRCGLKAKRFGSSMKFDMRYTRKIQYCIDDKD